MTVCISCVCENEGKDVIVIATDLCDQVTYVTGQPKISSRLK